jgi:hypothetical protein
MQVDGGCPGISRLGIRYHVRPPMITQPPPDPVPRRPAPPCRQDDHDDGADDPIWRQPAAQLGEARRESDPRPPPDPDELISI